ncbi:MAG: hypothetical protein ACREH3_17475 [Geminicoccales bacterium]
MGRPVAEANTATRVPEDVRARFDYLSQNGNSNCSRQFIEAIPTMPVVARLQGSCCSPMNLHRYSEQLEGLKAYRSIGSIPADPYDIEAGLAARLLSYYELKLSPREQAAYDYAMANSAEGGPCCCQCWRWAVYGGLAKHLIRDLQFTGDQIARIWDLSDGCGGDSHVH